MKKVFCLFVSCIICFATLSFNCLAVSSLNGGFEDGFTGFLYGSGYSCTVSDNCAASGNYSALISNRKKNQDTISFNVKNALTTPGKYCFSVCLRLSNPFYDYSKMYGELKIVTDSGTKIYSTDIVKADNNKFVCASATTNITWSGTIISAMLYPLNSISGEYCDFYADDFTISKSGVTNMLGAEFTSVAYISDSLCVGAIRSDSAILSNSFDSDYNLYNIPYSYNIKSKTYDGLETIINNDIEYARYAGLDYFAYRIQDGTYKYHSSSEVKMCFVIDNDTTSAQISQCKDYFDSNKYQQINSKPLVIFLSKQAVNSKLGYIENLGVKPFVALITSEQNYTSNSIDISFVGNTENKSFSNVVKYDSMVWGNAEGVYINSGAYNGIASRESVSGHISDGINVAKKGSNMALISSWNDMPAHSFIQPTYDGANNDENVYLIDTSVINTLHNLLGGSNNTVVTSRTIDGVKKEVITTATPHTDTTTASTDNAQNTPGSTDTYGATNAPNATAAPTDAPSNGISDFFNNIFGIATPTPSTEPTPNGTNATQDNFQTDGNKVYTMSNNGSKPIVIVIIIVCAIVEGILIYKFITVGKKKNDKKSGDNGQGRSEQSVNEDFTRDNREK